ncbi:hypothetical protein BpHYR1_051526 [Brachionus plicatilis]|uniref:Uncharacterized protein n=1 Tax=Brachionus plicatilis TaxID=10195 RepID=A0A3M7R9R7_BRAPC|nr:hypothetical protein BpHYR1_051526 [Brachionus plicatilis]
MSYVKKINLFFNPNNCLVHLQQPFMLDKCSFDQISINLEFYYLQFKIGTFSGTSFRPKQEKFPKQTKYFTIEFYEVHSVNSTCCKYVAPTAKFSVYATFKLSIFNNINLIFIDFYCNNNISAFN